MFTYQHHTDSVGDLTQINLPEANGVNVSLPPSLAAGLALDGINYRDRLISRKTLAHWLGMSPQRLGIWGRAGYGPKPRRCGGYKTLYLVGEVLDFIHASGADVCPDARRKQKQKPVASPTQV